MNAVTMKPFFPPTDKAAKLKSDLRREYLRFRDIEDQVADYSCGKTLTEYIRPDLALARAKCNEILANLREVDPTARHLKDI